ncbi:hypothetical protein GTQ40_11635 [Flavobacteriaceae bacterium R38]|nr:hypothetical protein [Flavobacteriaceae bacterium R38]
MVFQYVHLCVIDSTWMPFLYGRHLMSTGDFMKGIFTNSSVNMIISSFFFFFYLQRRKFKWAFAALAAVMFTTYMSGIVIMIGILAIFFLTSDVLKRKQKIILISLLVFFVILIYIFSPGNIDYVYNNLSAIFGERPPRKITSFVQTFNYWTEDPINFIFGGGSGKFSSRVAFLTSGDYASWFPTSLEFASKDFIENHFSLWNTEVLKIPYNDGTANQPFSVYNTMIGEFGLLGIVLFLFYLYIPLKYFKNLAYGKLVLGAILFYFLLDYWFEYFSVMIFFEIFIYSRIYFYKNNIS